MYRRVSWSSKFKKANLLKTQPDSLAMTRFNLILLIVGLLAIDGVLSGLSEKEMDDLESDMALGMRKVSSS